VDKEGHHQTKHVEKGDGFEMVTIETDGPFTDADIAKLLNDAMFDMGMPAMFLTDLDQKTADHLPMILMD